MGNIISCVRKNKDDIKAQRDYLERCYKLDVVDVFKTTEEILSGIKIAFKQEDDEFLYKLLKKADSRTLQSLDNEFVEQIQKFAVKRNNMELIGLIKNIKVEKINRILVSVKPCTPSNIKITLR